MHDRDDSERAEAVIAELRARRGCGCASCGARLCGHELLFGRVLGFRDAPRCLECMAHKLGRNAEALRNEARGYVLHQPCLRQGWEWANADEGHAAPTLPPCLKLPRAARERAGAAPPGAAETAPVPTATLPTSLVPGDACAAVTWDAGDLGCGELVFELRLRLARLEPGAVLALTAQDSGAREDLPAWCRMTGHALVAARHPNYWIRRT